MTAKDKAKELVGGFLNLISNVYPLNKYGKAAKQCALICVDQILVSLYDIEFYKKEDAIKTAKYWLKVKQEIEKL